MRPGDPVACDRPVYAVLYVDDDPLLLDVTKRHLEGQGEISVTIESSPRNALGLAEAFSFDVIVSGYRMREMDGLEFLQALRIRDNQTPFILFTWEDRDEVLIEAIHRGITFLVRKGGGARAQYAELERTIKEATRRARAEETLRMVRMRYRELLEYSGNAMILTDGSLRVISSNAQFALLTGYERSEIDGKMHWEDFFPEQYPDLRTTPGGKTRGRGITLLTRSGGLRTMLMTAGQISGTNERVIAFSDPPVAGEGKDRGDPACRDREGGIDRGKVPGEVMEYDLPPCAGKQSRPRDSPVVT